MAPPAEVRLSPSCQTSAISLADVRFSDAMTMSQYLGRGSKSRGRMTITEGLTTVVSTLPWLHDQYDVEAVIQGIKNLQASLASVPNLTWTYPNSSTTVEDFVDNVRIAPCLLGLRSGTCQDTKDGENL